MNKNFKSILVCDSREQKCLEFRKDVFDEVIVEGLPFGDYWNFWRFDDGTEKTIPICFERKGLGDLFGTMGKGYERFKKEMERAKEAKFHLILIIEGSIRDVNRGYEHSSIKGESMLKKLAMLRVRYDLEVLFFEDRKSMARWIEEVFSAVERNYSKT